MKRREFVTYSSVSILAAIGGFWAHKVFKKQVDEIKVPVTLLQNLCDLAQAVAVPTPSSKQLKDFHDYVINLLTERQWLGLAYLKFLSDLQSISTKTGIEKWSDADAADRLLRQYFEDFKNVVAVVQYGNIFISITDAPLKDMLLFFATGRGESVSITIENIQYLDETLNGKNDTMALTLEGEKLFIQHCISCHSKSERQGETALAIQNAIKNSPMMSTKKSIRELTDKDITALTEYLKR